MEWGGQWWHASLQITLCCLQSEEEHQKVMHEFHSVCMRRKLKKNAEKNKVMVFEIRDLEEALELHKTQYSFIVGDSNAKVSKKV